MRLQPGPHTNRRNSIRCKWAHYRLAPRAGRLCKQRMLGVSFRQSDARSSRFHDRRSPAMVFGKEAVYDITNQVRIGYIRPSTCQPRTPGTGARAVFLQRDHRVISAQADPDGKGLPGAHGVVVVPSGGPGDFDGFHPAGQRGPQCFCLQACDVLPHALVDAHTNPT